jgi:hypothetical protein
MSVAFESVANQYECISERLMRLRYIRQFIRDERMDGELDVLIAEAEQQLDDLLQNH